MISTIVGSNGCLEGMLAAENTSFELAVRTLADVEYCPDPMITGDPYDKYLLN